MAASRWLNWTWNPVASVPQRPGKLLWLGWADLSRPGGRWVRDEPAPQPRGPRQQGRLAQAASDAAVPKATVPAGHYRGLGVGGCDLGDGGSPGTWHLPSVAQAAASAPRPVDFLGAGWGTGLPRQMAGLVLGGCGGGSRPPQVTVSLHLPWRQVRCLGRAVHPSNPSPGSHDVPALRVGTKARSQEGAAVATQQVCSLEPCVLTAGAAGSS